MMAADNSLEAVLRIHNDPKLTTGEKMRKIQALVGGDFVRGRPSYEELVGRAKAASKPRAQRRSNNWRGF